MENVSKETLGVWRPFRLHDTDLFSFAHTLISSSISRNTSSLGIPLPSANSRRDISISRESSIWSKSASIDSQSTRYEAACPFCVMRTGRCVSRTRPIYVERLLRHSENGTTSSEGRQRRMGISRTSNSTTVMYVEGQEVIAENCWDRACTHNLKFRDS